MKITKEITVKLTTEEITTIIKNHLKTEGIDVTNVRYDINGHEDPNDWRTQFPLIYQLDGVTCIGVEEI